MKQFTESLGFIIFFLVMTLILSMTFGDKVTTGFLVLVLLGMLVVNTDKIKNVMGRFSTI